MIEQALYDHLREQDALLPYLTRCGGTGHSMAALCSRWICKGTQSGPWAAP